MQDPRRLAAATLTTTARATLLAWCRGHAPDMRVGYGLEADGTRRAHARLTVAGQVVELEAVDGDAVVRQAVAVIRQALRLPPPEHPTTGRAVLEREVVLAALEGRKERARELGRQLVLQRAGSPAALQGRTVFGGRSAT